MGHWGPHFISKPPWLIPDPLWVFSIGPPPLLQAHQQVSLPSKSACFLFKNHWIQHCICKGWSFTPPQFPVWYLLHFTDLAAESCRWYSRTMEGNQWTMLIDSKPHLVIRTVGCAAIPPNMPAGLLGPEEIEKCRFSCLVLYLIDTWESGCVSHHMKNTLVWDWICSLWVCRCICLFPQQLRNRVKLEKNTVLSG